MGAWGAGIFENDAACDWIGGLQRTSDLSHLKKALAAVSRVGDEYLEADSASQALAACETIARLLGNPGPSSPYTTALDEWVKSHRLEVPVGLVQQAIAVIDRISTPPSELLELWQEGDDGRNWLQTLDHVRSRL